MPSLIVVAKTRRQKFPLSEPVTVIGREQGVSLELSDFKVSRRHALLVCTAGGYFVKDLGSRNGVFLNQQRVVPRTQAPLKNGDVLSVGRTTLIFKDLLPVKGDRQPVPATTAQPKFRRAAIEPEELSEADLIEETGAGTVEVDLRQASGDADVIDLETVESAPKAGTRRARGQQPAAAIPRALPAKAKPAVPSAAPVASAPPPAGSPADVLLVRALERADQDRSFYRNLTLVLVCLLVGVMAWLLVSGLRQPEAQPEVAATEAGDARAAVEQEAAEEEAKLAVELRLDEAVFAETVHPILSRRCSSCHGGLGQGGGLVLLSSSDPRTVVSNLDSALRYVVPGRPEESPLLLAPLPESAGGLPHPTDVLTRDDRDWAVMRSWVAAAVEVPSDQAAPMPEPALPAETVVDPVAPRDGSPAGPAPAQGVPQPEQPAVAEPAPAPAADNQAPAVVVAPVEGPLEVGRQLTIDGGGSNDPDGDELLFRWTLTSRPDGSEATLVKVAGQPGQVTLTPDQPGQYQLTLIAHDGTVSASESISLEVIYGKQSPGRDAALVALSQKLLGQVPDPDTRARLLEYQPGDLRRDLLQREALYEQWWSQELDYLGLTGSYRPVTDPWKSMPQHLMSGRFEVFNVFFAIAISSSWTARYNGKDPYVDAVLTKYMGLEAGSQTKEGKLGRRLYDGFEETFLGRTGRSQADLVKFVLADQRSKRHLLRRTWSRVRDGEPDTVKLEAALERLEADPKAYFEILVEWATEDL